MSGKVTWLAWVQLVEEDEAWVRAQPRTLEREHVLAILADIRTDRTYYYHQPVCGSRVAVPSEPPAGSTQGCAMGADCCDVDCDLDVPSGPRAPTDAELAALTAAMKYDGRRVGCGSTRGVPDCLKPRTAEELAAHPRLTPEAMYAAVERGRRDRLAALGLPLPPEPPAAAAGVPEGKPAGACGTCDGTGYTRHVGYGNDEVVNDCDACDGTGHTPSGEGR